jgi:hypothetical protein
MSNIRHYAGNTVAYAIVIQCLADGPHTVAELHAESGLALNTVRKLIFQLKKRKVIRIAAWERDSTPAGRFTIAAYTLGSTPDTARPPRQTATQRSAARRSRNALAPLHFPALKENHEALQDHCQ